jgi:signal transduction histidine kinase
MSTGSARTGAGGLTMSDLEHPDADARTLLEPHLEAVLDVVRGVLSDLDLDLVLTRVVESAARLCGATYSALGVLDASRTSLERFITSGIDEHTRRAIGNPPLGRGVLGELIINPRPLRIDEVGSHPHSYGFPPGHPPMSSFLGVPVLVSGQPFGNLYLTNKIGGGAFTAEDERALVVMAEFAGIAIDHARRYSSTESQRSQLQSTVAALDATVQIAQAVGDETNLEAILELVAKRGRALVSARALVIEYERNDETVVAAAAGELPPGILGRGVDAIDSVASSALRSLQTLRLEEASNRERFERHGLGRFGLTAACGLVVPLVFRGRGYGVLIAIDRLDGEATFSANDQRLLEAFAASAATAIATAVSAEKERETQRFAATEQERSRWARELHDETLQNLAALRLGIATQLRGGDQAGMEAIMREAIEQLDTEIGSLRSLIADLRPTTLDDLGLEPALEVLVDRARRQGLNVDLDVDLAYEQGRKSNRLAADLETALYRIVQEALTNARKHGNARRVVVRVREDDTCVQASVTDDGEGFDPVTKSSGFGMIGIRERTDLLDGQLRVDSAPGHGATITVSLPVRRAGEQHPASAGRTEPVAQ